MRRLAIAIALVSIGCTPRKKMAVYTPPAEVPPAPKPAEQTAPAPEVAVGPALTPQGLVFPPGWPVPPMPSGMPTTMPFPIPSVFPFPFPAPTSAPTGTASPAPTAAPVPTAAPTPPPAPSTDGWPASSSALEDAVLAEVNARRAAGAICGAKSFGPAPPLVNQAALRTSARGHSQDMGTHNYFDHVSLDGRTPSDRMKAAGWLGVGYSGENIAAGNATAAATVQQWMNSTGHCENIMDPNFQTIGVGYFFAPGSKFKHYWTQNFAGPP